LVTTAQVTAHFLNEYADREVDRSVTNRTLFSGGSGVLVDGPLGPRVALTAGIGTTILSLSIAVWLVPTNPVAALLGLGALLVSWLYSMPPVRLLGTGWGELATTLVVIGVVPLIGVTSQGSGPPPALWAAIAVLLPVHLAAMLAFEVPDITSDRDGGKYVLAVRIGRRRTEQLIVALQVGAAGLLAVALGSVWLATTTAVAYVAALPAWVGSTAFKQDRFDRATAAGVATLVVVAAGLMVGIR
jgi:1,4-dihydroxy-2-naphthoate octaprenyltransferase